MYTEDEAHPNKDYKQQTAGLMAECRNHKDFSFIQYQ